MVLSAEPDQCDNVCQVLQIQEDSEVEVVVTACKIKPAAHYVGFAITITSSEDVRDNRDLASQKYLSI